MCSALRLAHLIVSTHCDWPISSFGFHGTQLNMKLDYFGDELLWFTNARLTWQSLRECRAQWEGICWRNLPEKAPENVSWHLQPCSRVSASQLHHNLLTEWRNVSIFIYNRTSVKIKVYEIVCWKKQIKYANREHHKIPYPTAQAHHKIQHLYMRWLLQTAAGQRVTKALQSSFHRLTAFSCRVHRAPVRWINRGLRFYVNTRYNKLPWLEAVLFQLVKFINDSWKVWPINRQYLNHICASVNPYSAN